MPPKPDKPASVKNTTTRENRTRTDSLKAAETAKLAEAAKLIAASSGIPPATSMLKPATPNEQDIAWIQNVLDTEEQISDVSSLAKLMRFTLNSVLQNQTMIVRAAEETTHIKHRVVRVESDIRTIDQYSRKDVVILTGLPYEEEEETEQVLVQSVLTLLKHVNPSLPLSYKDFSAIHRNGKKGNKDRPPSITLKFLRLHEKQRFMSKISKTKFKSEGCNVFHALCPRMIDEQSRISEHAECSYVFYEGPMQHFVAKLRCGDFVNYIRSYNEFLTKCQQHNCTTESR